MWEEQLRGFELRSQFHARLPLVKTARHPRNNTENFQTFNKFKYLFFICHIFLGFFWGVDEVLLSSRATVYIFWSLIFNIAPDPWSWFLDPILDPGAMLSWAVLASSCESRRSSGIIRWNWIHSNPKNKRFESNSLLLTWIL